VDARIRILFSVVFLYKYRVTRIKWNPCLGWEIFKIESKQMRDICFLKFGNTVKTGNCLNIVLS